VIEVVTCRALNDVLVDTTAQVALLMMDTPEALALVDVCVPKLPVIVIVREADIDLRLAALAKGASDYLLTSVTPEELRIRVQTVVTRFDMEKSRFLRRGCVVLDKVAGLLGDGLRWVTLTMSERQAFCLLLERQGQPVSHERLKQVGRLEGASDNALQVLIHRLRTKARACGLTIRNLRGEGYLLEYVG
jgi:DNA-binding response OmpR family regulator